MNNVAMAIEKIEHTRLVFEPEVGGNTKKPTLFVSGRMILLPENKLKFGVQIRQQGQVQALVEIYGYFDTKDFDPESAEDVTIAKNMGFGYLFPFARTTFSSLFSLAGHSIPRLPFILVDEVFSNVSLEKEQN